MKLVKVSPDIDWTNVKSDIPDEYILEWWGYGNFKDLIKQKGVRLEDIDFRLNLAVQYPYLVETKSRLVRTQFGWENIDKLLLNWSYTGTILVTETIYGKSSPVLADYQNDGTFLSEDGDIWKLTELVSWES